MGGIEKKSTHSDLGIMKIGVEHDNRKRQSVDSIFRFDFSY